MVARCVGPLTLLSLSVAIFSFTAEVAAQSGLKGGHYVMRDTENHLYIDDPGGSPIRFYLVRRYSGCSGSHNAFMRYDLPVNYNGSAINFSVATCSGTVDCGSIVVTCVGVGEANPASFSQTPLSMPRS